MGLSLIAGGLLRPVPAAAKTRRRGQATPVAADAAQACDLLPGSLDDPEILKMALATAADSRAPSCEGRAVLMNLPEPASLIDLRCVSHSNNETNSAVWKETKVQLGPEAAIGDRTAAWAHPSAQGLFEVAPYNIRLDKI